MSYKKFRETTCSGCSKKCQKLDNDIMMCHDYVKNSAKIYKSDNKVIAIMKYKNTYAKGVAKCNPSDSFDMDFGTNLAVARCFEKLTSMRLKDACNQVDNLVNENNKINKKLSSLRNKIIQAAISNGKARDQIENILSEGETKND